MATRSNIAMQQEDGTFRQIYCHWDGYPSNNGNILLSHYQNTDKVKQLLDGGNLSSLEDEIAKSKFYAEPAIVLSKPTCQQEWLYVWMKDAGGEYKWFYNYHTWAGILLKELTREVCNGNVDAKVY